MRERDCWTEPFSFSPEDIFDKPVVCNIGIWVVSCLSIDASLYLQNKATSGKQGLGIKDRPRKIAGCHFQGKKTSFDDSADEDPSDSSAKRKRGDISETENNDEPKVKLTMLCRKLLRQVCLLRLQAYSNNIHATHWPFRHRYLGRHWSLNSSKFLLMNTHLLFFPTSHPNEMPLYSWKERYGVWWMWSSFCGLCQLYWWIWILIVCDLVLPIWVRRDIFVWFLQLEASDKFYVEGKRVSLPPKGSHWVLVGILDTCNSLHIAAETTPALFICNFFCFSSDFFMVLILEEILGSHPFWWMEFWSSLFSKSLVLFGWDMGPFNCTCM